MSLIAKIYIVIPHLSPEEESILEKNLVWVFGSPRSGTSWLALELLSHNTLSLNETHLTEHMSVHNGYMGNFRRIIDFWKDKDDYFFSHKYKNIWSVYLRKLILNRIYAQLNDLSRKIIIKEPMAISSADVIIECLPHSKMIVIIRDGRDVVDSILDASEKSGFISKEGLSPYVATTSRISRIKLLSARFVVLMENLIDTYNNHSEGLRFLIKYEDLRKKTFDELQKLYRFLDIEISEDESNKIVEKYTFENLPDEIKGKGKFHRSATPGLWKEHFSDDEKKLMNDLMGDTLKKLDYEL